MTKSISTDIAIIGAGPVGLFAIFECGMLRMRCAVIDALPMLGGQCSALYPEKPIYDIPAYPSIGGQELVDKLTEQAAPFAPEYLLDQQVVKLTEDNGVFTLHTSAGNSVTAKAVIIAAGCGAFGPNKPPLDGLEHYEGSAVHYHVKRKQDFAGARIVIAGGGDSAVDWALSLPDVAEKVYVVHRRAKFRAAPESVAKMEALAKAGKIEMVTPYQLAALTGQNGQLSGVIVEDMDGQRRTLDANHLLAFFGLAMELGPIAEWGLAIEHNRIDVNLPHYQTSTAGIFAIGDIAHYPGKLKLILTGFAEAASAAHAAHARVHPGEALHFEYSTSKGVPGSS